VFLKILENISMEEEQKIESNAVEEEISEQDLDDIEVTTEEVADHANAMVYALVDLLVEKGILSQDEIDSKFEELAEEYDDEDDGELSEDEANIEYDGDELEEDDSTESSPSL